MNAVGHIELDRAVDSIRVGHRHRRDMGDLDALVASIARDGLLQPITITPDGVLVCGARRLAAVKQLGWRTVNVWVRSAISDRLSHLLAEQDDNVLHKELSPLEAESLYREIKQLLAEDGSRRQAASRFSTEHQPGMDGGAKFAPPSPLPGKTRKQAADMIPGGPSYATLDKIGYLRETATNTDVPERVQAAARDGLEMIDQGQSVHPIYQNVRDAAQDAELHAIADQRLAELKTVPRNKVARHHPKLSSGGMARYPIRAFVITWGELFEWWLHYDMNELVDKLTDEQVTAFIATAEGTMRVANHLRAARHTATDSGDAAAITSDDHDAADDAVGGACDSGVDEILAPAQRLRAL